MTFAIAHAIRLRIDDYFAEHRQVPTKLTDLPEPTDPLRDPSINDGWGKPFEYRPQQDGSVLLQSSGGDEGNSLLTFRFSVLDPTDKADQMPVKLTFVGMETVEMGVRAYASEHHKLPASLEDVYPIAESVLAADGWGALLEYGPRPDGSVILTSHGRPGGMQMFSLQFNVPGVKPTGPATTATEPSNAVPTSPASDSPP